LIGSVEGSTRIDIEMFSRGGLAILDAIESSRYDTLNHRPSLTKWKQIRLLTRALAGRAVSKDKDDRPITREEMPRRLRSESATVAPDTGSGEADAITVRDSYTECNRIARGAHSSFYLAFFGLPRDKRNALFALYAFMRLIDNVSDEPGDLEAKRRGLARWRGMLDEAISGDTSNHAILPALADSIAPRRFNLMLLGTFAGTALLLAVIGIYGAMSFFVAQQHHEIGIRVALGARPLAIRGMILRQVSRLTLAGLALGLVGAFGLRRFLASLLFGLAPTDPAVLGFVAVVVSAAALAAGVMPAVRAGRVEAARVIAGGGG